MPGMMDTILNLGLNDEAVEGLAASTGNPRFAYDSYRRLIQMYGEVVDGIDGAPLRARAPDLKRARAARRTSTCPADDLAELVGTSKRIYRRDRRRLPAGRARAAPAAPCRAVFDSWERRARRSTGARTGSRTTSAPPSTSSRWSSATRATTRAPASASRATRRPASAGSTASSSSNAQGEDVVAGIRTPEPLEAMRERLPEAFEQLLETMRARGALPRHAGHRVHGRGGAALPAPDAQREADGGGGAEGGGRPWSTRG